MADTTASNANMPAQTAANAPAATQQASQVFSDHPAAYEPSLSGNEAVAKQIVDSARDTDAQTTTSGAVASHGNDILDGQVANANNNPADALNAITPAAGQPFTGANAQAPALGGGNINTAAVAHNLPKPAAGQTAQIDVQPGEMLQAQFNPDSADLSLKGQDLVMKFDDGSRIVLQHFAQDTQNMPTIALPNGALVAGGIIVAQLQGTNAELFNLETAAGATAAGGGGFVYSDDFGNVIGGLGKLDGLGFTDLQFGNGGADPTLPLNDLVDTTAGSFGGGPSFTTTLGGALGSVSGGFEDWQPAQNIGNTTQFPMALNVGFTPDDNEVLESVSINSFPAGTQFFYGTPGHYTPVTPVNGSVTFTAAQLAGGNIFVLPPANSDADLTMTVSGVIRDPDNGQTAIISQGVTAIIDAVADRPILTSSITLDGHTTQPGGGAIGHEGQPVNLNVNVNFGDNDGSETHTIILEGVPQEWSLVSSPGVTFTAVVHTIAGIGYSTVTYTATVTGNVNTVVSFNPNEWTNNAHNQALLTQLTLTAHSVENVTDGEVTTANNTAQVSTTFTVFIDENTPIIVPPGSTPGTGTTNVTIQEHALTIPGVDTVNGNIAVDYQTDGPGDVRLSLDGLTALNLTSHGQTLSYALSADGNTVTATDTSGHTIFTVALGAAATTGSTQNTPYTFTLFQPLDHATANGANMLSIPLKFIATDADGDAKDSTVSITVVDDLQHAQPDTANLADNQTVASGNLLTNDQASADGTQVQSVTTNGIVKSFATPDGTDATGKYVLVNGQYGQMKVYENGQYTYTYDNAHHGGSNDVQHQYGSIGPAVAGQSPASLWTGVTLHPYDANSAFQDASGHLQLGNAGQNGAAVNFTPHGLGVQSNTSDVGVLALDLHQTTNHVDVQLSGLYGAGDGKVVGAEGGQWFAYNAAGQLVDTGTFNADNTHEFGYGFHSLSITTAQSFQYLVFKAIPQTGNNGGGTNTDSNYYLNGVTVSSTNETRIGLHDHSPANIDPVAAWNGVKLYAFDANSTFQDGNSHLTLGNSGKNGATVSYTDRGVGVDSPDGVHDAGIHEVTYTNGHSEALAIELGLVTNTAVVELARFYSAGDGPDAGTETGQWFAYNASGQLVGSGTVTADNTHNAGYGLRDFTITTNEAFKYLVFKATPQINAGPGGPGISDDSNFVVNGITIPAAPAHDHFTYTTRDGDGDTSSSTVDVTITDKGPGGNGSGNSGNVITITMNEATDINHAISGTIAVPHATSYALGDAHGAAAYDISGATPGGVTANGTLYSHGVAVAISLVGNHYIGMAGGKEVFTLSVNSNGTYSFVQKEAIDHLLNASNPHETINLNFVYTARDADGDAAQGVITVHVNDDVPVAHADAANLADGQSLSSGNLFGNDHASADGTFVQSVVSGGVTKAFSAADGTDAGGKYVLVNGQYGQMKVYENGQYTYTYDTAHHGGSNDIAHQFGSVGPVVTGQSPASLWTGVTLHPYDANSVFQDANGHLQLGSAGQNNAAINFTPHGLGVQSNTSDIGIVGIDLHQTTNHVDVQLSGLYGAGDGKVVGTEGGQWFAYNAAGQLVDTGMFTADNTHEFGYGFHSLSITTAQAFQYLVFKAIPQTGSAGGGTSTDSNYYLNGITVSSTNETRIGLHDMAPSNVNLEAAWNGVKLYAFDANSAFQDGSGHLVLANSGHNGATVSFTNRGVGVDSPDGVHDAGIHEVTYTNGHSEALAIELATVTNTAEIQLARFYSAGDGPDAGTETGQWFAYNASGQLVGSGSVTADNTHNAGYGLRDFTITTNEAFKYLVFKATPQVNIGAGGPGISDDSNFVVNGITIPPAPAHDHFTYTTRDGDGDTSSSTVDVTITDKGPGDNGHTGNVITITMNEATDINHVISGTIAVPHATSYALGDVTGSAAYDITGQTPNGNVANGTLYSHGVAVAISLVGNHYIGMAGGKEVFTLSVNGDGSYSFVQKEAVDHMVSAVPGDTINLNFVYTARDADGDAAEGVITVHVNDSAPVAHADFSVVSGEVAHGNVIIGWNGSSSEDTLSQDGPNSLSQVSFAGHTKTFVTPDGIDATNGKYIVIDGDHGHLKVYENGEYAYTLHPDAVLPGNGGTHNDVFTYTLQDGDGDVSSSTLTLQSVQPKLVVGQNASDADGSVAPYAIGTGSGKIVGISSDDLLIGDAGGSHTEVHDKDYNIVLMLDCSASMYGDKIVLLKQAVNNLLGDFHDYHGGEVKVHLVPFGTDIGNVATFTVTHDGEYASATNFVNGLDSVLQNTNYEAALQASIHWLQDGSSNGPIAAGENVSYFISDGLPNRYVENDGTISPVVDFASPLLTSQITGGDGTNEVAMLQSLSHVIGVGIGVDATTIARINIIDSHNHALDVHNPADLSNALQGASPINVLTPAGHDVIDGGQGHDLIFGDTINTDALALAHGLTTTPGAGWQVFSELETSHGWSHADTIHYIRNHAEELGHETLDSQGNHRAGGNDTINGGEGNDIIFAQEGNDTVNGGTGDDIITGGSGNNILTGGAGADTFMYLKGATGHDTITDYHQAENDKLDISDLLTGSAYQPGISHIDNYVKVDHATGDVFVDAGGHGSFNAANHIATISNISAVDTIHIILNDDEGSKTIHTV